MADRNSSLSCGQRLQRTSRYLADAKTNLTPSLVQNGGSSTPSPPTGIGSGRGEAGGETSGNEGSGLGGETDDADRGGAGADGVAGSAAKAGTRPKSPDLKAVTREHMAPGRAFDPEAWKEIKSLTKQSIPPMYIGKKDNKKDRRGTRVGQAEKFVLSSTRTLGTKCPGRVEGYVQTTPGVTESTRTTMATALREMRYVGVSDDGEKTFVSQGGYERKLKQLQSKKKNPLPAWYTPEDFRKSVFHMRQMEEEQAERQSTGDCKPTAASTAAAPAAASGTDRTALATSAIEGGDSEGGSVPKRARSSPADDREEPSDEEDQPAEQACRSGKGKGKAKAKPSDDRSRVGGEQKSVGGPSRQKEVIIVDSSDGASTTESKEDDEGGEEDGEWAVTEQADNGGSSVTSSKI